MIRRIAFVLVPVVIAIGAWLLLRNGDNEPVPGGGGEPAASAGAQRTNLQAADLAGAVGSAAPAEAAVERSAATSENDQPPIPADAKWLEVLVVDAASQQPVAGAEVRWNDGSAHKRIQALPEAERQAYYIDQELITRRFGWSTRSDANGTARITTDGTGTVVHGYSEGRYALAHVGGQQAAPPGGWRLLLEPDRTLRAQVLGVDGQPAPRIRVAIRMFGADGKPLPNMGWVQPVTSKAPDGIAEFRHIQNWLRSGNSKKRELEVAAWRVALDVPGHDDPGVAFDKMAPPAETIVLPMPPTGSLAVRLLYGGQPLTDNVSFCVFRGTDEDHRKSNTAERFLLGDDGWARAPHIALGGELTVRGWIRFANVDGTTPAPTGQGQEVRLELRFDGFFALAGRLLGPDGQLLRNTTAQASIDAEIMSGGGQVKTDAQGRFLWVLTKGYTDTPKLERLVLSQTPLEGTPLQVSVAPRDLVRGTNELGDLQLTAGALVVAGKFVFDPPDTKQQVQFAVEALSSRRQRDGAEVWEQVENLTPSRQAEGSFEVRGEAKAGRHRLMFHAHGHLPVAPLEFRLGADDLVIPIAIGHGLAATCLPPANLPANQLCGVLVPAGQVAAGPTAGTDPMGMRSGMQHDRYTAHSWSNSDPVELRWMALPAGTYSLEIRVAGVKSPLATIADVVVPPPAGGDPRLKAIDVRNQIHVRKLRITTEPKPTERWSNETMVFVMPQADPDDWEGLLVRNGEIAICAPEGPLDVLVTSQGFQPKQITVTDAETQVTLEPWPSVELTIANPPSLPEGIALHLSAHQLDPAPNQNSRRYHTEGSGGGLDGLLRPSTYATEVKEGRVRLQVSDGSYHLDAYLMARKGGNRRPQSLRTIAPTTFQGGRDLAPITVELSADEIKTALEELQKAPAKK